MSLLLQPETVPLALDADGVYRLSGTRVTLESVLASFHQGATAEEIRQQYPSVPLADVYSVIAFYLNHRSEVDKYMRGVEAAERDAIGQIRDQAASVAFRERLLARRSVGS